jgi:hypothetical protein
MVKQVLEKHIQCLDRDLTKFKKVMEIVLDKHSVRSQYKIFIILTLKKIKALFPDVYMIYLLK